MSFSQDLFWPWVQAMRQTSVQELRESAQPLRYPGAQEQASRDAEQVQALGMQTEGDWLIRHGLSGALDRRDDWMCVMGRTALLAAELDIRGCWPSTPFMALGTHWGAGMPVLADLCVKGRRPMFVYRQEPSHVFDAWSKTLSHILHMHALKRLGGSITLGGAYQRIMQALEAQATPVVLVDAPSEGRPTIEGRCHNFAIHIREGLLGMLAREQIPYVFYRCGFDPKTNQRQLEISPCHQETNVQCIADQAAQWLFDALQLDTAQWRLWMVAKGLIV